uniref:PAX-interacting protein 1 n=1 Tax=Steinernema glaseri TaxID=37863 RepID=A0A1I7YJT3_9BILA
MLLSCTCLLQIPICLQGSLSTEETRFVTDTVEQLGGIIVSDIEKATCFVAKEVRISTKFLCAIGKHIPIVSMDWVRESKAQGRLLKGTDYLLKDKEQEEKLNICIERVVNMEVPFLQKWVICCLPGVKPGPSDVAKLTRCCGGIFV